MLSFIVRKAEASRDLRELSDAEMASVAGGDGEGDVCPNGQPEQYISSLKCSSGNGCQRCTSDDVTCI